jgi:hypothetical protein
MTMAKLLMTIKRTSVVAHFEGLVDAPMLCGIHRILGYSQSHWTLPSGDYSLRIALVAATATANKTTMKKCTNSAGHFDGHGGARVQYCAHCLMKKVQGYVGRHWLPPSGKYCG